MRCFISLTETYTVSSNVRYFELELKHIKKIFHELNGCRHWIITNILNEVKRLNIPREHFQGIKENQNELPVNENLF